MRPPVIATRWRTPLACLLGALVGFLLYLPALRHGWAQDDVPIIRDNPLVHGLDHFPGLLLRSYWPDFQELWRPLALLSFGVEWSLFGPRPGAFHLVNLLWGCAAAVLVLLLVRRLGAPLWVATLSALLFAVHPLHVEATANVVGQADLAAAVFYLLACLLYLRCEWPVWARAAAVTLCYALALGFKEVAITLPAALVLLDAWAQRAGSGLVRDVLGAARRALPAWLGMAGVAAGYLQLRGMVLGESVLTNPAPYFRLLPAADRLATAARLIPELARLLAWPADLSAEWGPAAINVQRWSDPGPYLGLALLLLALVAAVVSWRRSGWTALAVFWILLTYLPLSQVFFPLGTMLAERTLYLSSFGAVLAAPALWRALGGGVRGRRGVVAAVLLLAALGAYRSWTRIPAWKDTDTLIAVQGREHPEDYRAIWVAAVWANQQGRYQDAIRLYQRTLALSDQWERPAEELAVMLLSLGRPAEAEAGLREHLARRPWNATAHLLLGSALLMQGRAAEVPALLRRAEPYLRAAPAAHRVQADHLAALALDAAGQYDSALVLRRRVGADPSRAAGLSQWMHLARLLALTGRTAEAEAALDSARVRAQPRVRRLLALVPLPPDTAFYVRGFGGPDSLPLAPPPR